MINEEYVTRHFCVWKIHIKIYTLVQDKWTHVKEPVVIKELRNLVTKMRAPSSFQEGTMCLGLVLRVQHSPRIPWAAVMPAWKFSLTLQLFVLFQQVGDILQGNSYWNYIFSKIQISFSIID